MSEHRCLFCYQPLEGDNQSEYHAKCSQLIFESPVPPLLEYTNSEIAELATQVVRSQFAVTGVQPKLSLEIEKQINSQQPPRMTIVGLWGNFIFKPPHFEYPHLPEIEHLTMCLAKEMKIKTVPNSLIRMGDGKLGYITRRIDKVFNSKTKKYQKLMMEDFCQLTGRLTEHKYHGSTEQIANAILKYSSNPMLDLVFFFEQVLFSFLTGNSDMHSKNFSLYGETVASYTLAPAYDMVATHLVINDDEELALPINGKKKKLQLSYFEKVFLSFLNNNTMVKNIFNKFSTIIEKSAPIIEQSFLPNDLKIKFLKLLKERHARLYSKLY